MQKLKLDVENLRVDSFKTSSERSGSGTVRGHDSYDTYWCTAPMSADSRCPREPSWTVKGTGC